MDRPRARVGLFLSIALVVSACEPTPFTLTVRVRSGLRAGYEARHVEVRLYEGAVPCRGGGEVRAQRGRALEPTEQAALASGSVTVGDFAGLAAGVYTVRTLVRRPPDDPRAAADEGPVLMARCSTLLVNADRVLRVPLTTDCLDVACPVPMGSAGFTECLHGRCVDPRCDPDDPGTREHCCDRALLGALCDTAPTLCALPGDCTLGAGCADPPRCEDGVCVEPAGEDCPAGEYCARALDACVPELELPVPDAGVDAGELDAGELDASSLDAAAIPDAASLDARLVLDASLPIPPPLALSSLVVGRISVTGVAARPAGALVVGRHDGSYTLFGSSGTGTIPQGFQWTTDTRSGGFFDLGGAWSVDDGPFVAIIDGATVITGGMLGAVAPGGCPRVTASTRDAYVLVYASGTCRWLRASGDPGSEGTGAPVGWREPGGSWLALVPVRAEGGAFGASFAAGAVIGMPIGAGSTGAVTHTWPLPFQPRALAVHGDDLVVVGDNGNVWDIDLGAAPSAPPRWTAVWEHPEGLWASHHGVAVDATGVYVVGSVTSRGTSALPGAEDAWVLAASRDGVRRWDLVFGGFADDRARVAATSGGALYVGGFVTGPTTAGLRSGSRPEREAIVLELDPASGVITGVARIPDGSATALAVGPTGTVTFTTESVVHTL